MTTEIIEVVRMPDANELQRVVDAWFDAAPIQTSYAAIQGDDEANAETGNYDNLDESEQTRVKATAVRYMWLSAVRKRLAKP